MPASGWRLACTADIPVRSNVWRSKANKKVRAPLQSAVAQFDELVWCRLRATMAGRTEVWSPAFRRLLGPRVPNRIPNLLTRSEHDQPAHAPAVWRIARRRRAGAAFLFRLVGQALRQGCLRIGGNRCRLLRHRAP